MDGALNLLYSCDLRGDLALLPRLYSLIARLKSGTDAPTLLLDLGNACSDAAWHCRETGGRSMLIALDAMGCDAANAAGMAAEERELLRGQVTVALIDEKTQWRRDIGGKRIGLALSPRADADLTICLARSSRTELNGSILRLRRVKGAELGQAVIDISASPRIVSSTTHAVTRDLPQNPSIAAAVSFIESEARLFQRKRGE